MGFFDWFKKDPKKAESAEKKQSMEKAAMAYRKFKKHNEADDTELTDGAAVNNAFLDEYSDTINAYIADQGNTTDKGEEIEDLLRDYYVRYPDKKPAPTLQRQNAEIIDTDAAAESEDKQAKQEEEEKNKKKESDQIREKVRVGVGALMRETDLDTGDISKDDHSVLSKGIDSSAMGGLKDVSKWILRNCVKTGAFGSDQVEYVEENILAMPARVKLFAYYLVEKGKQKETDSDALKESLAESQTGYKPNLTEFKNKMIASKFKFWKRFTAAHFYWGKIEDGILVAIRNITHIKPFGSLGEHDVSGSAESAAGVSAEDKKGSQESSKPAETKALTGQSAQAADTTSATPATGTAQNGQAQSGGGATAQSSPDAAKVNSAKAWREQCLKNYIQIGKNLMKAKREMATLQGTPKNYKEMEVRSLLGALSCAFMDLEESDKQVVDAFEILANSEDMTGITPEAEEDSMEKANSIIGDVNDTLGAPGAPADIMEKYNKFAETGNGIIDGTKLKESTSWRFDKIPDSVKNYMESLDCTGDVLEFASSALSAASVVLNIISLAQDSSTKTAGAKAQESMGIISDSFDIASTLTETIMGLAGASEAAIETTGGIMGAVAGGINVVSGVTSLISNQVQKSKLRSARDDIEKSDDITDKDKRKAKNTAELGVRLANTRQMNATIKTISGGLEIAGGVLTATGVASVVGAALGTVGSILSLTTNVVSFFRKKSNINDTIDEYINMNKMLEVIMNNVKNKGKLDPDKVKDQLRNKMTSKLHYHSKESLYNSITHEYATFIHNHVFFKNGNKSDPVRSKEEADHRFMELMEGYDLTADFSSGKPGIDAIENKMKNV